MVVSRIWSTAKEGVEISVQHSPAVESPDGKPGLELEAAANHSGLDLLELTTKASHGNLSRMGVSKAIMHEKSGNRSFRGSFAVKLGGIPALARCQESDDELISVKTTASNPR